MIRAFLSLLYTILTLPWLILGKNKKSLPWSPVLVLDEPFDPGTFLGKKFSIAEQDPRSEGLKEIDLRHVVLFGNCLAGEMHIIGEEKRSRLLGMGCVPFHVLAFIKLYREKNQESLEWIHKNNPQVIRLDFLGTVIKNKKGRRFGLYLYRQVDQFSRKSLYAILYYFLWWPANLLRRLFGKSRKFPAAMWDWGISALDIEWDSECYSGSIALPRTEDPSSRRAPISRVHPKGLSRRVAGRSKKPLRL